MRRYKQQLLIRRKAKTIDKKTSSELIISASLPVCLCYLICEFAGIGRPSFRSNTKISRRQALVRKKN